MSRKQEPDRAEEMMRLKLSFLCSTKQGRARGDTTLKLSKLQQGEMRQQQAALQQTMSSSYHLFDW